MTTATKFFRLHFLTVGSSIHKSPAKVFKVLTEKDMFLSFILKILVEHTSFSFQSSVTSLLHLSIMNEIQEQWDLPSPAMPLSDLQKYTKLFIASQVISLS